MKSTISNQFLNIQTLLKCCLFSLLFSSCQPGEVPIFKTTVTTVTEGNFYDGLAMDRDGNVYGSNFIGNEVYKLDTQGSVTVFAEGFTSPNGIGINKKNEIFICDNFGNKIFKYNAEGEQLESFEASSPAGIKRIPGTNDMLFVEYFTNTIKVLKEDGTIELILEGDPINGPAGIAFDRKGKTYIANFNDRKIFRLQNKTLEFVAQLPATSPVNNNFLGFLTYAKGYLFATQLGEHKIYKINPNKVDNFEVFAGSVAGNADGDLSEATFNFPNGILADPLGKTLYVSDAGSSNLRVISTELHIQD